MSTRHNQTKHLGLIILFAALVTSAFTPTPPPKTTLPACESIPDVILGGKGIISCTGFTPNGNVKVIFNRPDNTTSEDVGKADAYGNFNGTFTVALDRPTGPWMLFLVDLRTGHTGTIPFTVIPSITVVPTAAPVIPTVTPVPTAALVIPTVTPTLEPKLNTLHVFILTVLAFVSGLGAGWLLSGGPPVGPEVQKAKIARDLVKRNWCQGWTCPEGHTRRCLPNGWPKSSCPYRDERDGTVCGLPETSTGVYYCTNPACPGHANAKHTCKGFGYFTLPR